MISNERSFRTSTASMTYSRFEKMRDKWLVVAISDNDKFKFEPADLMIYAGKNKSVLESNIENSLEAFIHGRSVPNWEVLFIRCVKSFARARVQGIEQLDISNGNDLESELERATRIINMKRGL